MGFFILTKKGKNVCAVTAYTAHVYKYFWLQVQGRTHTNIIWCIHTYSYFSEVTFLHPVVKLTNVSDTLRTFVPISEKGKCSGVVMRDCTSVSWVEWACMYTCVCCVVACSEYKDAFSFYWFAKPLRIETSVILFPASVDNELLDL